MAHTRIRKAPPARTGGAEAILGKEKAGLRRPACRSTPSPLPAITQLRGTVGMVPRHCPMQMPHPLIMFGGASEGALEMGAAECRAFAIYAEPQAPTRVSTWVAGGDWLEVQDS